MDSNRSIGISFDFYNFYRNPFECNGFSMDSMGFLGVHGLWRFPLEFVCAKHVPWRDTLY